MRRQKEGCAVKVSKAISLGADRLSDQSGPTPFATPQSSFVIRCLGRVTRLAQQSLAVLSFPLGLQSGGWVFISMPPGALALRLRSKSNGPHSTSPLAAWAYHELRSTFFLIRVSRSLKWLWGFSVRCFMAPKPVPKRPNPSFKRTRLRRAA